MTCKMHIWADVTFCSASIYSLLAISVDRFYAIFYPFEYVSKRSVRSASIQILGAWLMGLIISSPMFADKPGFSNWNNLMNDESIKDNKMGGCMPPVSIFNWVDKTNISI